MTIIGTSNVTDWDAAVQTVNGSMLLNSGGRNWSEVDPSWFEEVYISIPVSDIDSGPKPMNDNIYSALKQEEHPEIIYRLEDIREMAVTDNGEQLELTVNGVLSVAGKEQDLNQLIRINILENGDLEVTGSTDMKMTDFNVTPPTFMRGALTTDENITVEFQLVFKIQA